MTKLKVVKVDPQLAGFFELWMIVYDDELETQACSEWFATKADAEEVAAMIERGEDIYK